MNIALYIWILLSMLHFAPIESHPVFPGYHETSREALARYGEIALDIEAVCRGKARPYSCAALLVAVGKEETHFSLDTDRGPCYRGERGGKYRSRCGGGKAASVWQVESDDFKPQVFFEDRQFAASLVLLAAGACRHLPADDQLAGLAGTCTPSPAHLESARARMRMWRKVSSWRWTP